MWVVIGYSSGFSILPPSWRSGMRHRRPEHAVASSTVLAFGAIEDPLPSERYGPAVRPVDDEVHEIDCADPQARSASEFWTTGR